MELDRTSSLPNGITEKILSLLPPWEAAKTSVLSTNWRYKSAMLQDLVFDEFSWDARIENRRQKALGYDGQIQTSFVNMVNHVLLLHIGPIRMFKLNNSSSCVSTREIDRWVTHLSRNSIKELKLLCMGSVYKIPLCVFSCQDLVCLELSFCVLKPPSTFKEFSSLKSLRLVHVDIDQDMFEILIRWSPLLERLTLRQCQGVTNLKIHAPNLQYLNCMDEFDVVNLESALNITEAEVYLDTVADSVNQSWVPSSSSNLLKIFYHLPDIRRLEIKRDFLKYLSLGVLPEKLPKPCEYLKVLSIDICFDDPDEILTALCILRSSPVLQKLEILMKSTKKLTRRPGVVEEQNPSGLEVNYNCTLPQLRLVKISQIPGVKAELDFIRFLLLSSPLLERMIVSPGVPDIDLYMSGNRGGSKDLPLTGKHTISVDGLFKLVKELLQFKRESKHAEIILLDSVLY